MAQRIAIVGASSDRRKFGNKAVRAYIAAGWEVVPVNPAGGEIEGLSAQTDLAALSGPMDRVALYVPPAVGLALLPAIAACQPADLIANPGADAPELLAAAEALGLPIRAACAIVAVGRVPAEFPG